MRPVLDLGLIHNVNLFSSYKYTAVLSKGSSIKLEFFLFWDQSFNFSLPLYLVQVFACMCIFLNSMTKERERERESIFALIWL